MLRKYFSKSRQQLSLESVNSNENGAHENNTNNNNNNNRKLSLGDELLQDALANIQWTFNDDLFNYCSHLAMPLLGILEDPICLSYFVQFLSEKQALALIKFYLDVENFKTVAITQLENDKLKAQPEATEKQVPELSTIYDLSMRKPLTDDEKSQIYADATKQLMSKSHGSETSLCSTLNDNEETCISALSIKDALIIFKKYLSANALLYIELPVEIMSQISLLLCQHEASAIATFGHVRVNCFDEAQQWVLQQLECQFLQDFLQSKYYCKYCVEFVAGVAEGNKHKLNICDILYSEAALFFFMEFLEQHNERECLDFWTQAINYRKSYSHTTAQEDAMILYDKYFSLQADCPLWLSNKLRLHVEQQICGEELANCFDLPLRLMAEYLQRKYLNDFLQSTLFAKYTTELKDKLYLKETTNNNTELPKLQQKHRKTLSEGHITQHNTLLAMDTSRLRSLHATAEEANLNIDARQLFEPQLLWRRRSCSSSSNLKFGSINALGRYERDFESVEAAGVGNKNWSLTASGNMLKNVMRKIVKLPEEKLQEEIAWQVAEMIIKDVTNITLKKSTIELEQNVTSQNGC